MDADAKDATDSAETVDVVDVTADADAATTDVDAAITAACGSSFFSVAAAVSATAVDAATAITVDAAADLFSVLPDVRAEKAPGADQPPRGFFSPEFSFSETVSVSVLLFPAFPSLLFFLFFSYIPDLFHKRHSLRVPVFFLLFLFHPFSGGLLFLSSSYHMFFPAFCHFFRPGT